MKSNHEITEMQKNARKYAILAVASLSYSEPSYSGQSPYYSTSNVKRT